MAYPLNAAPPPLATGHSRIVVGRSPGGWLYRARAYKIRVDGESAQKIRAGQYVVFDQPSGHYTVDARIDWTGSEEVGVDVFAGSVVHLRVGLAGSPLSFVWRALTSHGCLQLAVIEPPPAIRPIVE